MTNESLRVRLTDELDELNDKIYKLSHFVATIPYRNVEREIVNPVQLLEDQLNAMYDYRKALERRIAYAEEYDAYFG